MAAVDSGPSGPPCRRRSRPFATLRAQRAGGAPFSSSPSGSARRRARRTATAGTARAARAAQTRPSREPGGCSDLSRRLDTCNRRACPASRERRRRRRRARTVCRTGAGATAFSAGRAVATRGLLAAAQGHRTGSTRHTHCSAKSSREASRESGTHARGTRWTFAPTRAGEGSARVGAGFRTGDPRTSRVLPRTIGSHEREAASKADDQERRAKVRVFWSEDPPGCTAAALDARGSAVNATFRSAQPVLDPSARLRMEHAAAAARQSILEP